MNFQKTAVYGPGSIFNNYHEAEAHIVTLTHWCSTCNSFKSGYMHSTVLCCEVCKSTLLQPTIRATTAKEQN